MTKRGNRWQQSRAPIIYVCVTMIAVFAALGLIVLLCYPALTMVNPYRIPFSKEYWFGYLDSYRGYSEEELLVWKWSDLLKPIFTFAFLVGHYEIWCLERRSGFSKIPRRRFAATYLAGGLTLVGYALLCTRLDEYRLTVSLIPNGILAGLLLFLTVTCMYQRKN